MRATSKDEAFWLAGKLTKHDYEYDVERSARAGYPIYFSVKKEAYEWVCDLGDRLEVNLEDGRSINIWIKDEVAEARKKLVEMTKAMGYTAF